MKQPIRIHAGFWAARPVRRFLGNRLATLGLALFTVISLCAVCAPLITRYRPASVNLGAALREPSPEHPLGTDRVGRDMFARILYGGRVSILVGLGSALGTALIGVSLGCYSGFRGGMFDALALRVSEVCMSFPSIILVLLMVAITGQSLFNVMAIFILSGWGSMYRMSRARVLSLREETWVEALRAFGISDGTICFKHILPNTLGPIVVHITLSTASFILQEAGLSFLGLGIPMEIATWGNIINAAQDITILREYWWLWLPVGLVISLFVLSVNFIGDGFRDSTDPSQQG